MIRRSTAVALLCSVMTLLPAVHIRAADPPEGSPEAVVLHAVNAMNHERMDEFVRAMHPDALKQFHSVMFTIIDLATKEGKVEQLFPLFQVKELAELKKFDDRQFFLRFLKAITSLNPEVKAAMANSVPTVVGHIDEGNDTAHVVYRLKLDDEVQKAERMAVVTLRRNGSKWEMLLLGNVDAMLFAMKQSLAGKRQMPDVTATKIQPLGQVMEGKDAAHLVYRIDVPLGDSTSSKVDVVTVKPNESGWETVQKGGNNTAIAKLIKEKIGLAAPARP